MVLNTFKCNCLTSLHFKGLKVHHDFRSEIVFVLILVLVLVLDHEIITAVEHLCLCSQMHVVCVLTFLSTSILCCLYFCLNKSIIKDHYCHRGYYHYYC